MKEKNYNVFILGAGLGTRLRPLTLETPKPLVKILDKEVINYNLELFNKFGYDEFIINIAYKKEKYQNFKPSLKIKINYSLEDTPLGTGGGIKNASNLINKENIVIMNGDIIYDFNINNLITYHKNLKNPLALMVLKPSLNGNVTAKNGIITSLRGQKSKYYSPDDKKYKFTGLHIISKDFFNSIEEFCIIDTYIKHLNTSLLFAYIDKENNYWSDIGTLDSLKETENYLKNNFDKIKYLNIP